jgi:hypothetical protein
MGQHFPPQKFKSQGISGILWKAGSGRQVMGAVMKSIAREYVYR